MLQQIETVMSRPYGTLSFDGLDGILATLAPAAQKGQSSNSGFTCVGLVEWAAEQAGHRSGHGFIDPALESFRIADPCDPTKTIDVPLLSPQLLYWAMKASSVANTLDSITQWFQGLFDPVDFLVTDPLGRRLGDVGGTDYREIPGAFYPGNCRVERS